MERLAMLMAPVLLGLLFVALAVPLMRRRMPPNPWYGFRVGKTMRNRDVWYESNAYGGRLMAWFGALLALFSLMAAAVPGINAERVLMWSLGFMQVGVVAMLVLWYRHLGTLDEPPEAALGGDRGVEDIEMPSPKLLSLLFVLAGILFIGVSIPMVQRQVPPNGTYGFRTPATLSSPEVWYAANAYSGWTMIGAGAVIIVAAVGLALSRRVPERWYVPAMLGVLIVSLGASLALSFRYLATLT